MAQTKVSAPAPDQGRSTSSSSIVPVLTILLGALSILLLFAAVFLGWQYLALNKEVGIKEKAVVAAKAERDSLALEIKNIEDELRRQKDFHNVEVDDYMGQIESLKVRLNSNPGGGGNSSSLKREIKLLKEELETKNNQLAEWLKKEQDWNQAMEKLKQQLLDKETENRQLAADTAKLGEQVKTAAVLQISSIQCKAVSVNKKGKEKDQAKAVKVNRLECCFTVFRNQLAGKGSKEAYLVIKNPAGDVLSGATRETFESASGLQNYSASAGFDFNGGNQNLCIPFDTEKDLKPGKYLMQVYIDKNKTAESLIQLK
ncbi:MAG: hypothetical protein IBJ09_05075 [Bacteroidia bacterium]|nr:hypothetical protein [Bacteroidia bacterium]